MDIVKQIIVIRKDLGMRKGKMVAQGAHASIIFLTNKWGKKLTSEEQEWIKDGFAKICVGVNSEEELLTIYQKAKSKGLTVNIITDSGKTEFHGEPTKTCLAIGPHRASKINPITGDLKLL